MYFCYTGMQSSVIGKKEIKQVMETNKERDQLLERLRGVLLARSNECLGELLGYWLDLLVGEDVIEELLDDCCQLLDYHVMSAATGQSYQTYTAWQEIEGRDAANGNFYCEDKKILRQRIIALSLAQIELVMNLAAQAYAVIRGNNCEVVAVDIEFLRDLFELLEDSTQQRSNATKPALSAKEKKAERKRQTRALMVLAQKQGYLLLSASIPQMLKSNFRQWCQQQARLFITVKPEGTQMAAITVDAGTVGKALEAQGKLFPGAPQPSFTSSADLQERLIQIIVKYTTQSGDRFQPGLSFPYNVAIVTLANVAQEDVEAAIEEVLKLWADALVEYEAQLGIERAAYIKRRNTPPPDPQWLVALKQMRGANGGAATPSLIETAIKETGIVSEELLTRLKKEQLCAFLGLPLRSRIAKAELVQRLLTHCVADQAATAQLLEVFADELALEPWELEKELGCTQTERKRWTAEEKLPVLATRYFHKGSRDIEYPVYDRRMLLSASEREKMEQWRDEHKVQMHEKRKVAAKAAAETRRATNERLSKWGPLF
jgi:hypothetical protein